MGTAFSGLGFWRIDRGLAFQWLSVAALGAGLGIYVLVISTLPKNWMPLFAVAMVSPFVAIVAGDARKTLLGIIALDIPLQVDIHIAYRSDAAALGGIVGYDISITGLALVFLYAIWVSQLLTSRKKANRQWLRTSFPFGLFVLLTAISVFAARDAELSFFEIVLLAQLLLLFVYLVSTVREKDDVLFLCNMLLLGLVVESLVIIAVRFSGRNIDTAGLSTVVDPSFAATSRVGGTLGSPSAAGAYLALMLPFALAFMFTPVKGWPKWLAAVGFVLGSAALVITLTRGAWVAGTLALAVVCWFALRRRWMSPLVPLILICMAAIAFLLDQNAILGRIFLAGGDLSAGRLVLMQLAWEMIRDHPLLGVGANNFFLAMKPYLTPDFKGDWIYTVHNKYLLVWAEAGIGALLAFIWFLLAALQQGWRCWISRSRLQSALALGLSAGFLGQIVYMLVDPYHERESIEGLIFTAALIATLIQLGDSREESTVGLVGTILPMVQNS